METVDRLINLIICGVEDIKAAYAREGVTFPSLDQPYVPSVVEGKTMHLTETVVSAALQLVAAIRPAPVAVVTTSLGSFDSAALAVATQHNIAEILREAGPKGLHTSEIGKKARTQPEKLGRILRYLASRHIFVEVSPGVFANNRLSSVIDTGKSYEENFASPITKFDKTNGLTAFVEFLTDETAKSAAHISDYFKSDSVFSNEPNTTAFNAAYNTTESLFPWFAQPGHEVNQARFGIAMHGTNRFFPPGLVLEQYSWEFLGEGSIVVDVGGGIGSSTLVLAKLYPHLKFVIQDMSHTIKDSEKYWDSEFPEAISNGKVKLQVHDFFTPQPIHNASVFFLRMILHDWPTLYAKKILAHLRNVAQPTTRVVIVEQIVPFLSREIQTPSTTNISGAKLPDIPDPLVRGAASSVFSLDLQMLNMCGGMERTLEDWVECVDGTGWEISEVRHGPLSSLILTPKANGA